MKSNKILIVREDTDVSFEKICQWMNSYNSVYLRVNTSNTTLYLVYIFSFHLFSKGVYHFTSIVSKGVGTKKRQMHSLNTMQGTRKL